MPKDIPVSNGNLLFNFDSDYQIRDVYFPFIGQENHTNGAAFRFGVWVDGSCSWMGPEWEKDLRYHDNSLVTNILGISSMSWRRTVRRKRENNGSWSHFGFVLQ